MKENSSWGKKFLTILSSLAIVAAGAVATSAPAQASGLWNIKLDSGDFGPIGSVADGWWNEGQYDGGTGSHSVLKYVVAGSTMTLHYTVTDDTDTPVVGAEVSLSYAPTNGATFTGNTPQTTDADGKVTFVLVNTNTDDNAESFREDTSTWSDPIGANVKGDFIPYLTSGGTGPCTSTDNGACNRDRIWTHVIRSAAPAQAPTLYNLVLDSANTASMLTIGNTWWRENATSNSYVKYIDKGSVLTLTYTVTNHADDSPVVGSTVTLATEAPHDLSSFTGSLTGVTNAQGKVTFTLTNTNTVAENRRADMTVWSDPTGTNREFDIVPSASGADGYYARDRVWGHIVTPAAPVITRATITRAAALTGTAKKARVLTASATFGGSASTKAYQWYRCTATASATGTALPTSAAKCSIAKAYSSSASYTVATADIGKYMRVVVKATNSAGTTLSLSKTTAKVVK